MKSGATDPVLKVWSVTDGRAGNLAQALGLAEAIARRRPAEIRSAEVAGERAARLPARIWHGLDALAPGTVRRLLDPSAALGGPPWPDIAIGAGRRVAPLVAGLRRERVTTVQLLDPQMPAGAFDLVVAPEHDGLSGPNVLASLGALGRTTPATVAAEAALWHDRLVALGDRRLAVLLGGPGRMAGWTPADATRFLAEISALADAGWTLLLTASRRSDRALVGALKQVLAPGPHLVHTGEGPNPYPAILALAEAALVTEDSVNMVCEAAGTGLPVHVFRLARASTKARRFHDSLTTRGITRDFGGRIEQWSYPPLAEADRIAAEVLSRLVPRA